MAGDSLAEEGFVFGFDAGHIEKVFHALVHPEFFCKPGSFSVFDDISAFQPSGKIHRHKPAGEKTRCTKRAPDRPKNLLTKGARLCPQSFKPPSDPLAMMPFLGFDLFYFSFFGGFLKRFPMPAISKRRRDLAGIGVLKDADQVFAGIVQFNMMCSLVVNRLFIGDKVLHSLDLLLGSVLANPDFR